jgi:hypothetical protein
LERKRGESGERCERNEAKMLREAERKRNKFHMLLSLFSLPLTS